MPVGLYLLGVLGARALGALFERPPPRLHVREAVAALMPGTGGRCCCRRRFVASEGYAIAIAVGDGRVSIGHLNLIVPDIYHKISYAKCRRRSKVGGSGFGQRLTVVKRERWHRAGQSRGQIAAADRFGNDDAEIPRSHRLETRSAWRSKQPLRAPIASSQAHR